MSRRTAISIMVIAAVVFTGPALFRGRTLGATDLLTLAPPYGETLADEYHIGNPIQADQVEQLALDVDFWQSVRAGHFKKWEPNIGGGIPLFTAVYNRILTPWFFVFLFIPAWFAPTIAILIGLLIAEFGMYGLGRRLGLSTAGATLAAVAYVFSGPVLALLLRVHEALLLPVVLYAIHGALTATRRGRYLGLLSAAVSFTWFSGFPFASVFVIYVGIAWGLYLLFAGGRRGLLRRGLPVAGAMACGTLIASVQLLPSYQYLSATGSLDRAYPIWHNAGMAKLATAISGRFNGNVNADLVEAGATAGLVVLTLVGMLAVRRARSRPRIEHHLTRFFLPVGLFMLITSYIGGPTLAAMHLLPFMANNKVERGRFIFALSLALIAGRALDEWSKREPGDVPPARALRIQIWAVLALIAAGVGFGVHDAATAGILADTARGLIVPAIALSVAIVAMLAVRKPVAVVAVIVIAAAAVELQWGTWAFTPSSPKRFFYPNTPALAAMEPAIGSGGPYRFLARDFHALWPNTAAVLGVRDARYALPPTKRYRDLTVLLDPSLPSHPTARVKSKLRRLDPHSSLLDAMSVGYYILDPAAGPLDVGPPTIARVPATAGLPLLLSIPARSAPVRSVDLLLRSRDPACTRGWVELHLDDASQGGLLSRRLLRDVMRESRSYFVFSLPPSGHPWRLRLISTDCAVFETGGIVRIRGPLPNAQPIVSTVDWVIYQRPDALPRASLATATVRIDDRDRRLEFLGRRSTTGPVVVDSGFRSAHLRGGSARIVNDGSDSVQVDVNSKGPGFLVLRDVDAPGWRAALNGKEAPIVFADHAFRGVAVPPGRSTVTFLYDPPLLKLGALLALLGIAGTITLSFAFAQRDPGPY